MIIKRTAKTSILSLLLVVAIMSAAPLVFADEPTPRLPKMGSWDGMATTDPFVGGYFDIPFFTNTTKVKITVSFPNTSPSVIPADNYIAGGMFPRLIDVVRKTYFSEFLSKVERDFNILSSFVLKSAGVQP